MAKTTILNTEFEKFKNAVIHDDAPRTQIAEMEKAFYAGTGVMFALMCEAQISGATEKEFSTMMKGVHDEVLSFAEIQVSSAFDA